MKTKIIKVLLALTLLFAQIIVPTTSVHAEDDKANHAYYFGVSPLKQEIELQPGETYKGSFYALNNNNVAANYSVFVTPYQLTGENYDSPDYETATRYTQITDWISFPRAKGTIPANDKVEIKYIIKVPADVPADGQYASLMVEMTSTEDLKDTSGVLPKYDVGSLLYARVAGETRECGKILSNTTNTFLFEPKISASATVENCGNVHTNVKHTLQVFPLFSDEEVYTNEEDPEQAIALPETKRFITSSWDNAPAFGLFKVKHTVTIFGETNTINKVVLICPIWLTIIFIALLIAIIFWAASNRRQRKAAKANRLATSGVKTEKDKKD